MSVNNLSQHLTWLLGSESFLPSAKSWPDRIDSCAIERIIASQEHLLSPARSLKTSQPTDQPLSACKAQKLQGGMARLREVPSPTRRPPLKQAFAEQLDEGKYAHRVVDDSDNSDDPFARKDETCVRDASTSQRMKWGMRKHIPPTIDVHADPNDTTYRAMRSASNTTTFKNAVATVDLTDADASPKKADGGHAGNRTASHLHGQARKRNAVSRVGTKRKSEEHDPSAQGKRIHCVSMHQDREGNCSSSFRGFDLLDDAEDDPPPPYSTSANNIIDYTAYFSHSSDQCDHAPVEAEANVCTFSPRSSEQALLAPIVTKEAQSSGIANDDRRGRATPEQALVPPAVEDSEGASDVEASSFNVLAASGNGHANARRDLFHKGVNAASPSSHRTVKKSAPSSVCSKPVPTADLTLCMAKAPVKSSSFNEPEIIREEPIRPSERQQSIREMPCAIPTEMLDSVPSKLRSLCLTPRAEIVLHQTQLRIKIKDTSKAILTHLIETSSSSQPLDDLMDNYKKQLDVTEKLLFTRQQYCDSLHRHHILEDHLTRQISCEKISCGKSIEPEALSEIRSLRTTLAELEEQLQALLKDCGLHLSDVTVSSTPQQTDDRLLVGQPLCEGHETPRCPSNQSPTTKTQLVLQTQQYRSPSKGLFDGCQTPAKSAPISSYRDSKQVDLFEAPSNDSLQFTEPPMQRYDHALQCKPSSRAFYERQVLEHRHLAARDRQAEHRELSFVDDVENFCPEDEEADMMQALSDSELIASGHKFIPQGSCRLPLAERSGNPKSTLEDSHQFERGCDSSKDHVAGSASSLLRHPWSGEVKSGMRKVFGLRGFRHHQLDAINATLAGKDVFVLMPTGGGKSLCYQLPSIVKSGRTRGVTVVVSPLLSLMYDQINNLHDLGIQALEVSGGSSMDERRFVFDALRDPAVEDLVQMLYITPEMMTKSSALTTALKSLHKRRRLARIVIDEAHCVSQWGHDFRPDYKSLGEMRTQYDGVPVMALTATATENVRIDVMHNLNIENAEVFTQSFNRPNLTYEVRQKFKDGQALREIATLISGNHQKQSGIVYCFSRLDCERVAKALSTKFDIESDYYHAGMDADEKRQTQLRWQSGRTQVIVATIAFGMGIDKPDVRFVIHHTVPKSLEGYYQETGRAGRDGIRACCYLYYGFGDVTRVRQLIDKSDGNSEQKERQRQMLQKVVQFCENKNDCRRVQVLAYFSEVFKKEDCQGACDNCNSTYASEMHDFTELASNAVRLLQSIKARGIRVTLPRCMDIFRGAKTKKLRDDDHESFDLYGVGADMERTTLERLFNRLLCEDALEEKNIKNRGGFPIQYLELGPRWREFADGRIPMKLQIRLSLADKEHSTQGTKQGKSVAADQRVPNRGPFMSTNISSPVQAASRVRPKSKKTRKNMVMTTGSDMDEDTTQLQRKNNRYQHDDFCVSDSSNPQDVFTEASPPRRVRNPREFKQAQRPKASSPIASDLKMDNINAIHRMVVEDFVQLAKQKCNELVMRLSLRSAPFTDTMLRDMAIRFTCTKQEMLQVPGVDFDKVDCHAAHFLPLVRRAREHYNNMMTTSEDKPLDPNHENVVDLVSDDDDGQAPQEDFSEYEHDPSPGKQSTYFKPSHRVASFNEQLRQLKSSRVSRALSILDDDDTRDEEQSGAIKAKSRIKKSGPRVSHPTASRKRPIAGVAKSKAYKGGSGGTISKNSRERGKQSTIANINTKGKAIPMMPT